MSHLKGKKWVLCVVVFSFSPAMFSSLGGGPEEAEWNLSSVVGGVWGGGGIFAKLGRWRERGHRQGNDHNGGLRNPRWVIRTEVRTQWGEDSCSCSVAQSCQTLCDPMDCSTPGFTISQSLLRLMSMESVMPSNHLILCRPLLLLPSIFPSIRVFLMSQLFESGGQSTGVHFSISPSNAYSGLISFRTDWFDYLAVQGTLKSLLQHHSSKASILWCSAFFMVQLSHPYMTTRKTIALTRQIFVAKVMSLLFNMLSKSVTPFLPRSKCLLVL